MVMLIQKKYSLTYLLRTVPKLLKNLTLVHFVTSWLTVQEVTWQKYETLIIGPIPT